MKVVKDAMVLINLAKTTTLEKSCDYFENVFIAEEVFKEAVILGKQKGMADAILIENLVKQNKIKVKKVKNRNSIKLSNELNIYGGEAESLIIYKEENADFLISDDDNLRKKKYLVNANIIGSLAVLLKLRKTKKIGKEKFLTAIQTIRRIGWFSSSIIDRVLMEGENL